MPRIPWSKMEIGESVVVDLGARDLIQSVQNYSAQLARRGKYFRVEPRDTAVMVKRVETDRDRWLTNRYPWDSTRKGRCFFVPRGSTNYKSLWTCVKRQQGRKGRRWSLVPVNDPIRGRGWRVYRTE